MMRGIAWADGIENAFVHDCLDETFNSWMALFLQILQSSTARNFTIKMNALNFLLLLVYISEI